VSNRAFPRVIKEGHTKATIYKYANRDSVSYTVVWYEGEVRKRKVFGDLEEAKLHAQARVGQLSKLHAQLNPLALAREVERQKKVINSHRLLPS